MYFFVFNNMSRHVSPEPEEAGSARGERIMNNSEMKEIITDEIPKQVLKLVVGYGFNQKGACQRNGSLISFDHQFETLKEAKDFESETFQSGYGNTLRGITPITVWDEIEAELSDIDNDNINYPEGLEEAEMHLIVKNIAKVILKEIADKL